MADDQELEPHLSAVPPTPEIPGGQGDQLPQIRGDGFTHSEPGRTRVDVTQHVRDGELEAADRFVAGGARPDVAPVPSAPGEATQITVSEPEGEGWDARKAAVVGRAVNEDFLDAERDGRLGEQLEPMRKGEESYFERLYDMNPDHFASMPTSEFIDTAKRLLALEAAAETSKRELEEFSEKHGINGASSLDKPALSGEAQEDLPKFTTEEASDALKQIDALMDAQTQNPNPAVMEALDKSRRYLETFLNEVDTKHNPAASIAAQPPQVIHFPGQATVDSEMADDPRDFT